MTNFDHINTTELNRATTVQTAAVYKDLPVYSYTKAEHRFCTGGAI